MRRCVSASVGCATSVGLIHRAPVVLISKRIGILTLRTQTDGIYKLRQNAGQHNRTVLRIHDGLAASPPTSLRAKVQASHMIPAGGLLAGWPCDGTGQGGG